MTGDEVRENAVSGMNRIAMYAVAQHMLDHRLPAPINIEAPHTCSRHPEGAVMVSVPTTGLDAWLDTVDVQEVRVREVGVDRGLEGWEAVEHHGRIQCAVGVLPVLVKVIRKVETPTAPELRLVGTEVPC